MNMKRLTIVFFMLLCAFHAGAQEMTASEEAAKKKEINRIKLSEEAVYAEVYEVAADDEAALILAKRKTENLLQARIVEGVANELGMNKEDVKAIWDVIDDKCQNIVIRNKDLVRVFFYMKKDQIGFSRRKAKDKDIEKYLGEDNDSVAISKELENMAAKIMDGQDSINYGVHQPQIEVLPKKDTVITSKDIVPEVENVVIDKKDEEAQEEQEVKVIQPEPEVVVPEFCQTMISKENYSQLIKFLQNEKLNQRLMFGGSTKMQFHEKCYIVILEKASNKIIAVLDKGEADRMNFVTKKMDNFSNYRRKGYVAIFVQEYK